MNEVKIYFPDGHLEEKVWSALTKAGYHLDKTDRGYLIDVDHPDIIFKQARPQIMPFYLKEGKGVAGITGIDIFENAKLRYSGIEEEVVEVARLNLRPSKIVAAISNQIYPDVGSIDDFIEVTGGKKIMLASELPELAEKYCKDKGLNAIVFNPIGKTEAALLPPFPEADIIVEVAERGTTLAQNNCKVIDTLLGDVYSIMLANRELYSDSRARDTIDNLAIDINEVLDATNLYSLMFNVPVKENIDPIAKYLLSNEEGHSRVMDPSISDLSTGGNAVHVVVDGGDLKYLKPHLRKLGAEVPIVIPITSIGG